MNQYDDDMDRYESYEEQFNPLQVDRQARRKRRSKTSHMPKISESEIVEAAAETIGMEGGFQTSYRPSLYESTWLMQSLREFYQQELINDVEALIKGGKEANVYRCAAHPATGETWLAVKVYRPRMFRNLRNDHRYRQGRSTLMPDGRPVRARDTRLKKAMAGKTNLGKQMAHISWLMHEYTTLQLLYEAGGDVPRPVAAAENAILMSYIGDNAGAAPALNEITLAREEVQPLFEKVLENITLMLAYGRVHGDLSAYNILYWEGELTLIDFPQVVNSQVERGTRHALDSSPNPDAYDILSRDVARVGDYFGRYGLLVDGQALAADLWSQYVTDDSELRFADASRYDW
jgi:RIO kinase 1